MGKIVNSKTENYLRSLVPERDSFLASLEKEAENTLTYAPIIEPEVANLLTFLIKLCRPKRILELGSAIGYSAIVMARAMEDGELITVERYDKMYERTINNVKKANLSHIIKPVFDEAYNALSWLDGPFDMIFLDAAKGQYLEFLPDCLRLLSDGGLLISDDVLYKGEVSSQEETEKRKATLVNRLNLYLEHISNSPLLSTTVLPIGNGVALSVKLEDKNKD